MISFIAIIPFISLGRNFKIFIYYYYNSRRGRDETFSENFLVIAVYISICRPAIENKEDRHLWGRGMGRQRRVEYLNLFLGCNSFILQVSSLRVEGRWSRETVLTNEVKWDSNLSMKAPWKEQ